MAARGRPRQEIEISDAEIAELERMVGKRSLEQSISRRAQIVLLCAKKLATSKFQKS